MEARRIKVGKVAGLLAIFVEQMDAMGAKLTVKPVVTTVVSINYSNFYLALQYSIFSSDMAS
jgi:hypothetical protein